jgi:hypothetical protein
VAGRRSWQIDTWPVATQHSRSLSRISLIIPFLSLFSSAIVPSASRAFDARDTSIVAVVLFCAPRPVRLSSSLDYAFISLLYSSLSRFLFRLTNCALLLWRACPPLCALFLQLPRPSQRVSSLPFQYSHTPVHHDVEQIHTIVWSSHTLLTHEFKSSHMLRESFDDDGRKEASLQRASENAFCQFKSTRDRRQHTQVSSAHFAQLIMLYTMTLSIWAV